MNSFWKALALYAGAFFLLWLLGEHVILPAPQGFEVLGACGLQWVQGLGESMLSSRTEGLRPIKPNGSGQTVFTDERGGLYEFTLAHSEDNDTLGIRHTSNEYLSNQSLLVPLIERGIYEAQYTSPETMDIPGRKSYLEDLFTGWEVTACYETDRLSVFSFRNQNTRVQAALRAESSGSTLLLGSPAIEGGY